MKLSPDEWDLIDDALIYWSERITYTLANERPPASVAAAGARVRREINRLRAKICPMLPDQAPLPPGATT